MSIIDKYEDREYSALATNNGVVLCDKYEGAFLVMRSAADLERLKRILNEIRVFDQQCDRVDTSKMRIG